MPKLKVAIVGSGRVATMLHMPAIMALKGKLPGGMLFDYLPH